LIQNYFHNNQKANTGLIAYEVARLFSSDNDRIHQILQVLPESESNLFKRMDVSDRIDWLMENWGFKQEFEAFRTEMETFNSSKLSQRPPAG
jgi:hypothetical protein